MWWFESKLHLKEFGRRPQAWKLYIYFLVVKPFLHQGCSYSLLITEIIKLWWRFSERKKSLSSVATPTFPCAFLKHSTSRMTKNVGMGLILSSIRTWIMSLMIATYHLIMQLSFVSTCSGNRKE